MPSVNWIRALVFGLLILPILEGEELLQPLSLERVVIKGEARRNPTQVKGPWREEVSLLSGTVRVREERVPKQRPLRVKTHGKVEHGSHDHLAVNHSFFLLGENASIGYLSSFLDEEGHRSGYGQKDQDFRLEGTLRSLHGLDLKASLWHERRELELPEPLTLADVNDHREEEVVGLAGSVAGQTRRGETFKLLFDFEDAQQDNTAQLGYRYRMVRAGGVFKANRYEMALSLEWERKGQEQTTLMRTFVKRERKSIDERTSFHAGLGVYVLSSKQSQVDKSGLLSILGEDKNSSVAFSPYLRLDHRLGRNLAFYASTTRFYESLSIPKVFFGNPLANVPPSIHQPSLNLRFESGFRLDIEDDWHLGLSLEWTKKRLAQIWVIDVPALNGRLNTQTFDQGRESLLHLSLRGPISPAIEVEAHYQHLWSRWDFPSVEFTPFVPEVSFSIGVFLRQPKWRLHAELQNDHNIRTWPVIQRLSNRRDLELGVEWVLQQPLTLFLDVRNALNHDMEDSISFPSAPWSSVFGLKADL